MKRFIIGFILLIVCSGINAQDKPIKRLFYSLSFSIQKNIPKYLSENNINIITSKQSQFEKSSNSLRLGLKIHYLLSSHFFIGSGINYTQYKIQRYVPAYSPMIANLTQGQEIKTNFSYDFLQIPVFINYQFKIKKLSIYTGLGVLSEIMINNNLHGDSEEAFYSLQNTNLQDSNPHLLSASALSQLGFSYPLNSKLSIFIEVYYKHILTAYKTQNYTYTYGFSNNGILEFDKKSDKITEKLHAFGLTIGFGF